MSYEIQDDFQLPASAGRTRAPGEFRATVGNLQVGQGFTYTHTGKAQNQYARIAPKKFGETTPGMRKAFKVVQLAENVGQDEEGKALHQYAVKRLADKPMADKSDDGAGAESGAEQPTEAAVQASEE